MAQFLLVQILEPLAGLCVIMIGVWMLISITQRGFGTWLRAVLNLVLLVVFIPIFILDALTKTQSVLGSIEEGAGFGALWFAWSTYRARADARAADRRAQRAAARAAAKPSA